MDITINKNYFKKVCKEVDSEIPKHHKETVINIWEQILFILDWIDDNGTLIHYNELLSLYNLTIKDLLNKNFDWIPKIYQITKWISLKIWKTLSK